MHIALHNLLAQCSESIQGISLQSKPVDHSWNQALRILPSSILDNLIARGRWRFVFKFAFVGATGAVINLTLLWLLTAYVHIYYIISALIAIEISIIWNFFLNTRATFNYNFPEGTAIVRAMARYHAVSFGGMLINLSALLAFTEVAGIHYVASEFLAILIAFTFNYLGSINYVWREAG